MKYMKILAVAAVAAAALMAFAGTASATTVTSGGSTLGVGATLHSVLKEGEAILKSSFIGEVKCKESTVAGSIGNAGGAEATVSGEITKLTFTNCNATVEVKKAGTLEVHTEGASDNGNGTLTSNGAEVTTELAGIHCIFTTSNTDIGTVAGTESGAATFTAKSAAIPRTGGRSGAFCGSSASWNATYTMDEVNGTKGANLYVH